MRKMTATLALSLALLTGYVYGNVNPIGTDTATVSQETTK